MEETAAEEEKTVAVTALVLVTAESRAEATEMEATEVVGAGVQVETALGAPCQTRSDAPPSLRSQRWSRSRGRQLSTRH